MANPNYAPNVSSDAEAEITVLDIYLAIASRSVEHRERLALARWNQLTPQEQLERRNSSIAAAGTEDLPLGAEYTQAILLFDIANEQTEYAA